MCSVLYAVSAAELARGSPRLGRSALFACLTPAARLFIADRIEFVLHLLREVFGRFGKDMVYLLATGELGLGFTCISYEWFFMEMVAQLYSDVFGCPRGLQPAPSASTGDKNNERALYSNNAWVSVCAKSSRPLPCTRVAFAL
jgi:hypothetical protein